MNPAPFSSLSLRPELLSSTKALGYVLMTPVQEQTLPHLLNGKDLIAQARTGSGKTAALQSACLISSKRNLIPLKRLCYVPHEN